MRLPLRQLLDEDHVHQPRIEPVEALRGMAALSVTFLHTAHEAQSFGPAGRVLDGIVLLPWAGGVDVFFVISGLVMAYSSAELFATADGMWRFALRRLARIVPLYWVMTTLTIATGLILAGALSGDVSNVRYLLASYLFLPYQRPDGFIQPVLRLGWTLNYELEFYAIFCLFLSWPRRPAIAGVIVSVGTIVMLGHVFHPSAPALRFWTDPIIGEFACGVILGSLLGEGVRLPSAVRATLFMSAVYLALIPGSRAETPGEHVLFACCAVAGAAMGPAALPKGWPARWAIALGEMSYALYLVHPFAMRLLQQIWTHLGFTGYAGVAAYVAAALTSSVVAALVLNRWIERPIAQIARRSTVMARPTGSLGRK